MKKERKKKLKKDLKKEPKKGLEKPQALKSESSPEKKKSAPKKGLALVLEKKWFYLVAIILLSLISLLSYLPSFKVPFQFDDQTNIVNNRFIRIVHLNSESLFRASFQDFKQNRPLSNLSFGLNYYFNGLKPFGFHLVNFFFHLLSGICLLILLKRIFSRRTGSLSYGWRIGILSSLLWLVHPINTQAVSYIVQRHSSMAGAFSLLCLVCYDLARNEKKKLYYVLSILSCLAGMMSKETVLVMPVFIFLYELWFFQELKPGWLKKSWLGILAILAFYLLSALVLFSHRSLGKFGSSFQDFPFSPLERSLTQGRVLLWYLSLILYPAGFRLSVDHQFELSQSLIEPLSTLPAYLVILGLIAWALLKARRYPLLSFGILWYFGQLTLEALPLPIDLTFEHRLYLACIPVLVFIPLALLPPSKKSRLGLALILLLILFFSVLTFKRNQVWLSPVRLWRDASLKAPELNRPWNNLCSFYLEEEEIKQAIITCQRALKIDPNDSQSHLNYGLALYGAGDLEKAEQELLTAIKLKPKNSLGYFNLGVLKFDKKETEEGKYYFQKVEKLGPRDATVYYNMGVILNNHGETEEALAKFEKALALRPEWVQARLKVASGLANKGRCEEALKLIAEAPEQSPSFKAIIDRCQKP